MKQIRIVKELAFPREDVWQQLTDSELLAQWLMPNDFEPIVGHEFTFQTDPAPGFDGIVRCRVLELDEPSLLAYTWAGGNLDTVVTFRLKAIDFGTRLTLEHDGFTGKSLIARVILGFGWKKLVGKKLLSALENHRPEGAP